MTTHLGGKTLMFPDVSKITSFEETEKYIRQIMEYLQELNRNNFGAGRLIQQNTTNTTAATSLAEARYNADFPVFESFGFSYDSGTHIISWNAGTVHYLGTSYSIAAGSSDANDTWLWWSKASGDSQTTFYHDTSCTLTLDYVPVVTIDSSGDMHVAQLFGLLHCGVLDANTITANQALIGQIFTQNLELTGSMYMGNSVFASNTDIWLGEDTADSDKKKFRIGSTTEYLEWDGTDLNIIGNVTIKGSGGSIRTFVQSAIPTSENVGDQWCDTDDNGTWYRAATVGADEITAGEWETFDGAAGGGVVWKGAYAGGTAYVPNEITEEAGVVYMCILNSTGNTPPNATYWELFADKGDTGATGDTGAAGADGADGTQIFRQDAQPVGVNGDVWFETDADNKPYVKVSGTWTSIRDTLFAHDSDTTKIDGGLIYTGTVVADSLAANSVVAGKIAANAVDTNELATNSITAVKITASSIETDKINGLAVSTAKVAADAITNVVYAETFSYSFPISIAANPYNTELESVTITTTGATVLIWGVASIRNTNGGYDYFSLLCKRGTTALDSSSMLQEIDSNDTYGELLPFFYVDASPGTGSVTYYIYGSGENADFKLHDIKMAAMEIKK